MQKPLPLSYIPKPSFSFLFKAGYCYGAQAGFEWPVWYKQASNTEILQLLLWEIGMAVGNTALVYGYPWVEVFLSILFFLPTSLKDPLLSLCVHYNMKETISLPSLILNM